MIMNESDRLPPEAVKRVEAFQAKMAEAGEVELV